MQGKLIPALSAGVPITAPFCTGTRDVFPRSSNADIPEEKLFAIGESAALADEVRGTQCTSNDSKNKVPPVRREVVIMRPLYFGLWNFRRLKLTYRESLEVKKTRETRDMKISAREKNTKNRILRNKGRLSAVRSFIPTVLPANLTVEVKPKPFLGLPFLVKSCCKQRSTLFVPPCNTG